MAGSKSKAEAVAHPNEGARLLAVAMAARGLNQEAVEALIGAKEGNVSHWKRGKRIPGRVNGQRLYELFGIDPRTWDMPAKQAQAAELDIEDAPTIPPTRLTLPPRRAR